MEMVEKSVREVLGKKRKAKRENEGDSLKRFKIWMGKRKVDNSNSDDSDKVDSDDNEEQEKEKSVVLDNGNHLDSNKEPEGSSNSVTGGNINRNSSGGGSSGNNSDGDEEISIRETLVNGESSGEAVQQSGDVAFVEDTVFSETEAVKTNNVTVSQQPSTSSYGDVECLDTTDSEMILDPVAKPVLLGDVVKPLNFEEFNSSAKLEVNSTFLFLPPLLHIYM